MPLIIVKGAIKAERWNTMNHLDPNRESGCYIRMCILKDKTSHRYGDNLKEVKLEPGCGRFGIMEVTLICKPGCRETLQDCILSYEATRSTYLKTSYLHIARSSIEEFGFDFDICSYLFKASSINWVVYEEVRPPFKYRSGSRMIIR